MKKIFLSILLFLFFILIIPKNVFASCDTAREPVADICYKSIDCYQVTGSNLCCDNANECPVAPTPTPVPNPCDKPQLINTAIGPIDVCNINSLTASILRLGIGIGGGIAFILMLAAVFMIMTSAGDPKRMQAGQELITSALMGLLLIIFSVFLLQLIGVQILAIPGFSK